MVAAGVTGLPSLAVSDAEAEPVGKALKACADYYGWDFVEKFGPILLLGLTMGGLEAKVIARTKADLPRIAAMRAEARERKRERKAANAPAPAPDPTAPPPTAPVNPRGRSAAAQLAAAEEAIMTVPENLTQLLADA